MDFSDKLNGFWEEGYHFYIEIRDGKMTVREYRRKIMLETAISYDADSVEKGLKTPIKLEDNVLSYGGANNPMSWFEEFYFEDGLIRLVEGYSFMDRKDPYTLKKVDHGPFDHIVIRDDEFRERLQGPWVRWSYLGDYSEGKKEVLFIDGNEFHWKMYGGKFHVISYRERYRNDSIYMVPWDLTESDFHGCCRFEVLPDMLTTHEMIFDMSTPLSVFAREEDLDKIEVPPAAKGGYVSTMGPAVANGPLFSPVGMMMDPGNNNFLKLMEEQIKNMPVPPQAPLAGGTNAPEPDDGIKPEFLPCEKEGDDPRRLKKPYACKSCGEVFEDRLPKFCPNCGGIL